MSTKTKTETAWGIVNVSGTFLPYTVRDTRDMAIKSYEHNNLSHGQTWESERKRGVRCVKLSIAYERK